MDSNIVEAIWQADSYDDFFSHNRDLSLDDATALISARGKYGIEIVFSYLDAFNQDDHTRIAEVIGTALANPNEDSLDFAFGYPRDSDFEPKQNSHYKKLSEFLIDKGQLRSLVESRFEFDQMPDIAVLEMVEVGQTERVLKHLGTFTPQRTLELAHAFERAGQGARLYDFLGDQKNRGFVDQIDADQLFEIFKVIATTRPFGFDNQYCSYLISRLNEVTQHSYDDVVIEVLAKSDGYSVLNAGFVYQFDEPERIIQAIEIHPNVGDIVRALENGYGQVDLPIVLPDYIKLAHKIVPYYLDENVIQIVKEATLGIDLSKVQISDLDHEGIRALLSEQTLDEISFTILQNYKTARVRFNDLFNEQSALFVPMRIRELEVEYPFLSEESLRYISTLDYLHDSIVFPLQYIGVTKPGKEGLEQIPLIFSEIRRQLETDAELTFSIGDYDQDQIVSDLVTQYIKELAEKYDAIDEQILKLFEYDYTTGKYIVTPENQQAAEALGLQKLEIENRVDELFSQLTQRCISDDNNVANLLVRYSNLLGDKFPMGLSRIFIPSALGEVKEKFGFLDRETLEKVIKLKLDMLQDYERDESYLGFEDLTYEKLLEINDEIINQLDQRMPLNFSLENEFIKQIVLNKANDAFNEVLRINVLLRVQEPGSQEYERLSAGIEKNLKIIDDHLGSIALGALSAGKSPLEPLENFRNNLIGAGIIERGETYLPSVFNPIGEHFGGYPIELIDDLIRLRFTEQTPESMREIGITATGAAGYQQALNAISEMRKDILSGNLRQELLGTKVFTATFAQAVRIQITDFSAGGIDAVEKMLQIPFEQVEHSPGTIRPLDRQQTTINTTSQLRDVYNNLVQDFSRAKAIVHDDGSVDVQGLQDLFEKIESLAKQRIENLEKQKQHIPPTKVEKIAKIDAEIASLSEVTSESLWDFPKFFKHVEAVSQFKEFKRPLRELLMVSAVSQNPNLDVSAFVEIRSDQDLDLNQAAVVADFIEHITFSETWKKAFEEHSKIGVLKHVLKSDDLTSFVAAVEAKAKSSGTRTQFTLVPVRGPLLEASGSIASTCWNYRAGSITTDFPNITAVLIVKDSNTPMQSRFAGAGLLIQAKASDGSPILIIRGLNPLQNDITELMQDSFFREFALYADSIAKEQGRKLAVVIDSGSGQALTNRPTLFAYVKTLESEFEKVELSPDVETTFNGYDLTDKVFLVDIEKLSEQQIHEPREKRRTSHRTHSTESFRPGSSSPQTHTREIGPVPIPTVPKQPGDEQGLFL
ncbi:MAG: hypothetical protein U0R17_03625 [Acidimicrobiia bacterium]